MMIPLFGFMRSVGPGRCLMILLVLFSAAMSQTTLFPFLSFLGDAMLRQTRLCCDLTFQQ